MKLTPLDSLFAKYIKLKSGAEYQEYDGRKYLFGNCEYCGQWAILQCSHLHGRARRTTRYDEDNVSSICGGCHKYLDDHPPAHVDWFKKRLGSDKFEQLSIRSEKTIKELSIDYDALEQEFKEGIRKLEG